MQDVSNSYHYRKRYSAFWKLSGAGLDEKFKKAYLTYLENNKSNPNISVIDVCEYLYELPANYTGAKKLQFSFATKLVHMVNPEMPIYDRMVKNFFHFSEPGSKLGLYARIDWCDDIYTFLKEEYKRILRERLLEKSINIFRSRLNPKYFSDEKIIDSLIWKYVSLAKNGAFVWKEFQYF
jgi:hypothetical protein